MSQLTQRQREALARILHCVASWTTARYDQHLRWDIGDEDAQAVIDWLAENVSITLDPKGRIPRVKP